MRKEGANESRGDQTVQDSPADKGSSQSIGQKATWQYDRSDYWSHEMYGHPASNGTCIRNSYG